MLDVGEALSNCWQHVGDVGRHRTSDVGVSSDNRLKKSLITPVASRYWFDFLYTFQNSRQLLTDAQNWDDFVLNFVNFRRFDRNSVVGAVGRRGS